MKDQLSPDLLTGICHDLRGPLGAISTWVQVLSSGRASEETQARALASIGADVQNMGAMIEQLSTLATFIKGEEPPSLERLDLGPILKSSASIRRDGDLETELQITGSLPVRMDAKDAVRMAEMLFTRPLNGKGGRRTLKGLLSPADVVIEVTLTSPARIVPMALLGSLGQRNGGTVTQTAADDAFVVALRLPAAP